MKVYRLKPLVAKPQEYRPDLPESKLPPTSWWIESVAFILHVEDREGRLRMSLQLDQSQHSVWPEMIKYIGYDDEASWAGTDGFPQHKDVESLESALAFAEELRLRVMKDEIEEIGSL